MVRNQQQAQEQKTEDENSNESNHLDDPKDEMLRPSEQSVVDHTDDEGDEEDEVHTCMEE